MLRESLRDKANLREFLASALPDQIDNFDFEVFEEVPREVFAGDWHEREADLIFEIGYRIEGRTVPATVGILIEHQSDTDICVPLRSLYMLAAFRERWWRQWDRLPSPRPPFRLPPAFSVVLYTADRVWGSHTNVRQLLDEPAALHPFAPDWGPVFWNLADRTVESLLAGSAWMQLMALMRATAEERDEYERVLTEACQHIAPMSESDFVRWSRLVRMVISHVIFRRPADEHDRCREVVAEQTPEKADEVRAMAKTTAEVLEERGEARGERRGKLVQARAVLRKLLARFASIPETLAERIEATTDLEKLEKAAIQVLGIESIEDLTL